MRQQENLLTPMEIEVHINNNFGDNTTPEKKLSIVDGIIKGDICTPEAKKILANYRKNLCTSMILD